METVEARGRVEVWRDVAPALWADRVPRLDEGEPCDAARPISEAVFDLKAAERVLADGRRGPSATFARPPRTIAVRRQSP